MIVPVRLASLAIIPVIVSALHFTSAAAQAVDHGGYRPHYQGFGVHTPAGRGGAVHRVTNLDDSGPGSLREAATSQGARFILFEVSGTIVLSTPLVIDQPFVTIAGQTAPSPGITLRGPGLIVDTHDVVVQHLRIRVGALPHEPHGLWMRDHARNVVIDHVSVSWAVWTSVAVHAYTPGRPPGEVTILDSIVAEGLACSGVNTGVQCDPARYPRRGSSNSRGILIGDGWDHPAPRVTLLRNLSANTNDRHPEIGGRTQTVLVNNLIYNPSLSPLSAISYHDGHKKGPSLSIVKGNVLIPGPTTPGHNGYIPPEFARDGDVPMIRVHHSTHPDSRIYLEGNFYGKQCVGTRCLASSAAQWMLARDLQLRLAGRSVRTFSPPFTIPNLPLSSAMPYSQVEAFISANAGARPLDRDAVDRRTIAELSTRTGSVPNRPSDKAGPGTGPDGFPILAFNRRALTLPDDPHAVADEVGRTRMELWLEGFARALEPAFASSPLAPAQPGTPAIR